MLFRLRVKALTLLLAGDSEDLCSVVVPSLPRGGLPAASRGLVMQPVNAAAAVLLKRMLIIINWKASLHTFIGFCIAVIALSPLILPHVNQLAVAKGDDAVTAHDSGGGGGGGGGEDE